MKRYLAHLLIVSSLFGGTYDDTYTPQFLNNTGQKQKLDLFMHGDFLEVKRFDALHFSGNSLDSQSEENFDFIVRTIDNYQKEHTNIKVKVIGHTRERTDVQNEVNVQSNTYMNSIKEMFSTSFTEEDSDNKSIDYANKVTNILEDNGILESSIVTEHRLAKDIGFTSATDEGTDLSNRVMVSVYVLASLSGGTDDDHDGVLNAQDRCPQTKAGVLVNSSGCERDSDNDGVSDTLDECPMTPSRVTVNTQGCPLDSDGDGVFDYKDQCPDIVTDLQADSRGCPILKELRLNFRNKSATIPSSNYNEVENFALFLKANPTYNVQVVGHTDSVGAKNDNMILSFSRANAVKSALIKEGIKSTRIKALGRGELEPIKSNRKASGRAFNRRIEVKLFK